jgi:Putative phage serine protease XkdF
VRDHGGMDAITAINDAFGGAVDAREVVSKMDPSEVHVNQPLQTARKKKPKTKAEREKRQAQVGLASNILGLTAGGAAMVAAARNPALRKPVEANAGPVTSRAVKYVKSEGGRARLIRAGAAGALGLQVANTGGDVVANRVLNREAKKKVAKRLEELAAHRRMGVISTAEMVEMGEAYLDEIEKGLNTANQIFSAGKAMRAAGQVAAANTAHVTANAGKHSIDGRKKIADSVRVGVKAQSQAGADAVKAAKVKPMSPRAAKRKQMEAEADKIVPQGRRLVAMAGLGAVGATGVGTGLTLANKKQQRQQPGTVAKSSQNIAVKLVRRSAEEAEMVRRGLADSHGTRYGMSRMRNREDFTMGLKGRRRTAPRDARAARMNDLDEAAEMRRAYVETGNKQMARNAREHIRRAQVGKRADEADLEWVGTISKVSEDRRLVFGWCSISKVDGKPVVDLQGDYVPIETTEEAAYKYVISSRKGGDMHRRVAKFGVGRDEPFHTADLVESFVVTQEKLDALGLSSDQLPLGWWVGFKVNDDEQWARVKKGERPGFSIHGSGRRVSVPEEALA